VGCRIGKPASERGNQVANRRGGGGERCVEKRKKVLNRGNEPKNALKARVSSFDLPVADFPVSSF
jgi:hypothetical protein